MAFINGFSKSFERWIYIPSYMETDGTNYIDTGFQPTSATRIRMAVSVSSVTENGSFFGARATASGTDAASNTLVILKSGPAIRSDFYGGSLSCGGVPEGRFEIDRNGNVTTISGASYTNTAKTGSSGRNLFLGATNTAGAATLPGRIRIFQCQIWESGTLARDFVPWREDSGVSGLYDKCGGTFYPLQSI